MSRRENELSEIPDARDGLTRAERVVLHVLAEAEREFSGRSVPTATLYGRVLEHVDLSVAEFQRLLARLTGRANAQNVGAAKPRPGRANK